MTDKTIHDIASEFETESKQVYELVVNFLNALPQSFAVKGQAIAVLNDQLLETAKEQIEAMTPEEHAAADALLQELAGEQESEDKPPHLTLVH